jgi:hypothetical protein
VPPKDGGSTGVFTMQIEQMDRIEEALLDWTERDRAYEAWRNEFFPPGTGALSGEGPELRPLPSVDCVERGLRLHDEAVRAQDAYLRLRRDSGQ